ncbi:MAG: SAVED domain-containing protein [Egibacteraceae bacterium]
MKRVFLSYRRTDAAAVSELEQALRRAGALPWRDVTSLCPGSGETEEVIRETLVAECSVAVLWLTRQALGPTYVMRVELPAMLDAAQGQRLGIVPVFVDMGVEEAAGAVFDETGRSIHGYPGVVPKSGEDTAALARRVATAVVRAHLERVWDRSAVPQVQAVTFAPPDPRDDCVLAFDWSGAYRNGEAVPGEDERAELKAALASSLEPLRAAGGHVSLALKTRLSVAFAFGYELRRPTGVVPLVDQYGEVWAADDSAGGAVELVESAVEYGDHEGSELAVEVSITDHVRTDVREFAKLRDRRFRAHLRFEPPAGPAQCSVPDAAHANAWARQVRERMTKVRGEVGAREIALLFNGPSALAVLIGWWCNQAGPLTFYEWGHGGPYQPGWHIP